MLDFRRDSAGYNQDRVSPDKPRMAQIGPYEVLEEIGRGAMGVVFRGFDPSIARPVAIKVIRPQQLESNDQTDDARRRFVREASAAGRLSHHNIVTVYQLGEDHGRQYLAMEFVDGKSLSKLMSPDVPIDPEIALCILRQIADGLDYAHSKGVVHRDIKPANILVRADRVVKIADFGIAHISSQTLTQPGSLLGTLGYIAPEQIQGLRVDGRAELNPALGRRVSALLQRGLAKDAITRFCTCGEMSGALTASIMEPEPEPVQHEVAAAPPPAPRVPWVWMSAP